MRDIIRSVENSYYLKTNNSKKIKKDHILNFDCQFKWPDIFLKNSIKIKNGTRQNRFYEVHRYTMVVKN